MRTQIRSVSATAVAASLIAVCGWLPPSTQAQQDAFLLEEIVVTARKRSEDLQATPISITAFSGAELQTRGIDRMDDIANYTPNLTFQNSPGHSGSGSAAAVYIRGIGQQDFVPTVDPGVGIYLDGVYIARSLGAVLDLVDVERIEVLRGPQGTLFGRNTTGGAINIISKVPTAEFQGNIGVRLGTDSRQDIRLVASGPLGDSFGAKLSVAKLDQDGYLIRTNDGIDLGNDDTVTGQMYLTWEVSDRFSLNLAADYTSDRENGPAMELFSIGFDSVFWNPVDANGNFDPQQIGNQIATMGINSLTPVDNFALLHNWVQAIVLPQFGVTDGTDCLTTNPGQPYRGAGNAANPRCYNEKFILDSGLDGGTGAANSELDTRGMSLTATWDISEDLRARSITSFRTLDGTFSRDGDHSPLPIVLLTDTYEQDQFSQELQLLGSAAEGRLNWIVGFYAFSEDGTNVNDVFFPPADVRSGGDFDHESTALYAQATYDLNERWSVTLGLRYTDEEKSFSPDQYILADRTLVDTDGDNVPDRPAFGEGARVLPFVTETFGISETTPLVNVAYQSTDDLMIYATYSEGFKSGGFTQRVFPPLTIVPRFDPEFVTAYELGWKYTGLDNRLRVNGAVFTTDYEDIQVSIFDPSGGNTAPIFRNAAEASIEGLELEAKLTTENGLQFEAGLGWIDPGFDAVDSRADEISLDSEFERVSEWTASFSVFRTFDVAGGAVTPRIDYAYRSEYFNDALNTDDIAQNEAVSLINATVQWRLPNDRWSLLFSGTNLTNERYVVAGLHNTTFDIRERIYHRGREWFITATFAF